LTTQEFGGLSGIQQINKTNEALGRSSANDAD